MILADHYYYTAPDGYFDDLRDFNFDDGDNVSGDNDHAVGDSGGAAVPRGGEVERREGELTVGEKANRGKRMRSHGRKSR
jgi:hypothetical protein